jgi:hypothetical protein
VSGLAVAGTGSKASWEWQRVRPVVGGGEGVSFYSWLRSKLLARKLPPILKLSLSCRNYEFVFFHIVSSKTHLHSLDKLLIIYVYLTLK